MLIFSFLLSSCATIFKGTSERVTFNSEPSSAKVYVNGHLMGSTPFKISLKSKDTYFVEFRKEGYETRTVYLSNSIGAGYVILDILFGLVPVIIDAATGSCYMLDQTYINVFMEKQ